MLSYTKVIGSLTSQFFRRPGTASPPMAVLAQGPFLRHSTAGSLCDRPVPAQVFTIATVIFYEGVKYAPNH